MVERGYLDYDPPGSAGTIEGYVKEAGVSNGSIGANLMLETALDYNLQSGTPIYPQDPDRGRFSYEMNGDPIPFRTYGELARMVIARMVESESHRENLLSKDIQEIGVAINLYRAREFHNLPMVKLTILSQWYEPVK